MEKEKDYLKGYLSALSEILKTISKLDEDENVVELNILKNNVENKAIISLHCTYSYAKIL